MVRTLRNISTQENGSKKNNTMDFQEELKQNLRSAETVYKEEIQQKTDKAKAEAQKAFGNIKYRLLESARNAQTETIDGVTSVYCFCEIPSIYMKIHEVDNIDELRKDAKKLIHDPLLRHHIWCYYDVSPTYYTEYFAYISALKELAEAENITIKPVIYNKQKNQMASFPTVLKDVFFSAFDFRLCVRATSIISVDENCKPEQSTTLQITAVQDITPKQDITPNEKQFSVQQVEDDSNKIFICLFILIVVIGIAVYVFFLKPDPFEMGGLLEFITIILLIGTIIFVSKKLS